MHPSSSSIGCPVPSHQGSWRNCFQYYNPVSAASLHSTVADWSHTLVTAADYVASQTTGVWFPLQRFEGNETFEPLLTWPETADALESKEWIRNTWPAERQPESASMTYLTRRIVRNDDDALPLKIVVLGALKWNDMHSSQTIAQLIEVASVQVYCMHDP